MTKFLKMYGSERNHGLYNPLVDVKKLYKFVYDVKPAPGGKRDRIMMSPACHDFRSRYMIAGYVTVMSDEIEKMKEYTTDLIRFIARAPDGAIIKTFKLNYADVEYEAQFNAGKKTRREEVEGEWIMEVE
jgi:hypothetical protein